MKAQQLVKILRSVEPNTDVFFNVGYDKEERKALLDSVGFEPDILNELDAYSVEISEVRTDKMRVDVYLYPYNDSPKTKNDFLETFKKQK